MAWGGENNITFGGDIIWRQAKIIYINCGNMAAGLVQNTAQCRIAWVFYHRGAPLCKQHLSGQPKGILRTKRDQDFICACYNSAPGQCVTGNKFKQLRVIAIKLICC